MNIVNGNFLEVDWSAADIVFFASVLYPVEVMDGVADKCQLLKPGSRVVSLREMPERPFYKLYAACHARFSWGVHEVLFYRR